MLNIIYSEILKLKKSSYIIIILITSLFMVFFTDAAIIIVKVLNRTFESYSFNVCEINIRLIFTIIFCIISSNIFIREYDDKTANILYSYSFNRIKILLGKFLVIYMIIVLIYFIQCIGIYISSYVLFGSLDKSLISQNVQANLYSMIFEMALIPSVILLANLKQNLILPVSYGVLITIINAISDKSFIADIKYNPFVGPLFAFQYVYSEVGAGFEFKYITISGIIFFIISILVCMYHFNKMDIN